MTSCLVVLERGVNRGLEDLKSGTELPLWVELFSTDGSCRSTQLRLFALFIFSLFLCRRHTPVNSHGHSHKRFILIRILVSVLSYLLPTFIGGCETRASSWALSPEEKDNTKRHRYGSNSIFPWCVTSCPCYSPLNTPLTLAVGKQHPSETNLAHRAALRCSETYYDGSLTVASLLLSVAPKPR